MRIIVAPPEVTRPDPSVMSVSLTARVKLSPNVLHVKAGTPLALGTLGWEIARPGRDVLLFATSAGRGGEQVPVAQSLVVDLNLKLLVPCARYAITDIDDTGYPIFSPSADGPYVALSDQAVLLTPDV